MNEVKYHVVLELTPDQIMELKLKAIRYGMSIKELVTRAVEEYLKIFKEDKT